jgi:hypothetical protein
MGEMAVASTPVDPIMWSGGLDINNKRSLARFRVRSQTRYECIKGVVYNNKK